MAMAATCGQWGGHQTADIWQRVQQTLYSVTKTGGTVILLEYQRYPLTLVTYAACLGAMLSRDFTFINTLLQTKLRKENEQSETKALDIVPPFCMLQHPKDWSALLEGMSDRKFPLNDWLHNTLRECLGESYSSHDEYTLAFDTVEILLALSFGKHLSSHQWRPPGCYGYRTRNFELVISDIKNSINTFSEDSIYVKSELFGNSAEECLEQIRALSEFSSQLRWR